jgi:hypothetical protein
VVSCLFVFRLPLAFAVHINDNDDSNSVDKVLQVTRVKLLLLLYYYYYCFF